VGTDTARATINFTPAKGNMTSIGLPCRGPVLEGFFNPNQGLYNGLVLLEASRIPTGQMALVELGVAPEKSVAAAHAP